MTQENDIARVLASLGQARAELEQVLARDERWRALKDAERTQGTGKGSRRRARGQGKGKLQKALRQHSPVYRAYTRLSDAIQMLRSLAPMEKAPDVALSNEIDARTDPVGAATTLEPAVAASDPEASVPRRIKVKAISVVLQSAAPAVADQAAETGRDPTRHGKGGGLTERIASVAEAHGGFEGRPLFAADLEEAEVAIDSPSRSRRFAPETDRPKAVASSRSQSEGDDDFDSDGYAGYHTYVEEATVEIVRRDGGSESRPDAHADDATRQSSQPGAKTRGRGGER